MYKCSICNKEFTSSIGLANHLRGGCKVARLTTLCKPCPNCNQLIYFDRQSKLNNSIKKNSRCRKCSNLGREISSETKNKITQKLLEKYKSGELIPNMKGCHSNESRKKQSKSKTGSKLTDEHKNNISKSLNNSEKFKIALKSENRRKKISKAHTGKVVSEKTKRLQRINSRNRFYNLFGDNFHPNFNKNACGYFDILMEENKIFIQHALNGGEFYIEELGYWVDGYDIENNTVYEFDEKHHFDENGLLREKDIIRQKQIIEILNCNFIRIKE